MCFDGFRLNGLWNNGYKTYNIVQECVQDLLNLLKVYEFVIINKRVRMLWLLFSSNVNKWLHTKFFKQISCSNICCTYGIMLSKKISCKSDSSTRLEIWDDGHTHIYVVNEYVERGDFSLNEKYRFENKVFK